MEEVRRCSFCGKTPIAYDETIRAQNNRHATWVWCPNRQCDNYGKKWALAAWNTRPIEDELQETITTIEHEVAQVYVHFSDGKIAKCNTDHVQVIAVIESVLANQIVDMIQEALNGQEIGFDRDGNEIPKMKLYESSTEGV